jgi:hypothetical protein
VKSKRRWSAEKHPGESPEGYQRRMERRREIARARAHAEIVFREGRAFMLLRLPERIGTL